MKIVLQFWAHQECPLLELAQVEQSLVQKLDETSLLLNNAERLHMLDQAMGWHFNDAGVLVNEPWSVFQIVQDFMSFFLS